MRPADRPRPHLPWTIGPECRGCTTASALAPGLIGERADGRAYFLRQPETSDDVSAAWRAALACPVHAVRPPPGLTRPKDVFPQQLGPRAYRLGYNHPRAAGAQAYFVCTRAGRNLLIDGPRYVARLVDFIDAAGGLDAVLLTHRDDVGDAEAYAGRFGAPGWIHADDASAAPWARMLAEDDVELMEGVRAIAAPGHTRGSVVYLIDDEYLMTGDSLHWSHAQERLEVFAGFCWYDIDVQMRSLARLRRERFSWVLPGHGGSVEAAPERMQSELAALLERGP